MNEKKDCKNAEGELIIKFDLPANLNMFKKSHVTLWKWAPSRRSGEKTRAGKLCMCKERAEFIKTQMKTFCGSFPDGN